MPLPSNIVSFTTDAVNSSERQLELLSSILEEQIEPQDFMSEAQNKLLDFLVAAPYIDIDTSDFILPEPGTVTYLYFLQGIALEKEQYSDAPLSEAKQCDNNNELIKKLIFYLRIAIEEIKKKDINSAEYYQAYLQVLKEKEELEQENHKLKMQIDTDSSNSGTPPSQDRPKAKAKRQQEREEKKEQKKRKQREKGEEPKKPGGQNGHKGHTSELDPNPDEVIIINDDKYADNERYVLLDEVVRRQIKDVVIEKHTVEYQSPVYLDTKTGKKVYAKFPEEATQPVSYGETIKTLAIFLTLYCNMSYNKTQEFFESTVGFSPCQGTLVNFVVSFARAVDPIYLDIVTKLSTVAVTVCADHMNVDVGGSNNNSVAVFADGIADVLYVYTETKSLKDLKEKTFYDDLRGNLVHDGAHVFDDNGNVTHQQCLAHVLRRITRAIQSSSVRHKWMDRISRFLQGMIHFRNIAPDVALTEEQYAKVRSHFSELVENGLKEYEDVPGADNKGKSILKDFKKDLDAYIVFLKDPSIYPTNNAAEQAVRPLKRKGQIASSFRSPEFFKVLCRCLSVIQSWVKRGEHVYDNIRRAFS